MPKILLEVKNLKKYYPVKKSGLFQNGDCVVKAVDDVSFCIYEGETVGLVGESGCGKTTTGRAILRLLEPTEGKVLFEGKEITKLSFSEMRVLRREMQIVFQDPYGCLDPRKNVGQIISQPIKLHNKLSREQLHTRVIELMETVGLRAEYISRYPHEFSGGQRQRIGIARALALNPKFIVCDEPVSALDVSIQAQVINLMKELQVKLHLTYLFISHDLRVVHHICDRVAVMYLGRIVEIAPKDELYANPCHPYTQALLSAIPEVNENNETTERVKLEGDIPSPLDMPSGCRFHTRCRYVQEICRTTPPPQQDVGGGHLCECHFCGKLGTCTIPE